MNLQLREKVCHEVSTLYVCELFAPACPAGAIRMPIEKVPQNEGKPQIPAARMWNLMLDGRWRCEALFCSATEGGVEVCYLYVRPLSTPRTVVRESDALKEPG